MITAFDWFLMGGAFGLAIGILIPMIVDLMSKKPPEL